MTSSPVLAILKLQHENVRISVKNRLMSKISSYACKAQYVYISLQKKIGCFNHWVVANKLRRQWFILVLETNCTTILSPNHALQLTNWSQTSKHLWGSHYNYTWCFCGYYTCKTMVVRWSGKLPLWLSYAISKIYNTCSIKTKWLCP